MNAEQYGMVFELTKTSIESDFAADIPMLIIDGVDAHLVSIAESSIGPVRWWKRNPLAHFRKGQVLALNQRTMQVEPMTDGRQSFVGVCMEDIDPECCDSYGFCE